MLISEFTDPIRPRNVDEGTIAKQPPKFRVGYINDDDDDSWMNTTAVNASAAAGKFFDMYRKTPTKVQRYSNGIWKTEEGWTVDTRTVNERLENLREEYRNLKKKIAKKRKLNEFARDLTPAEQIQQSLGISPEQYAAYKNTIAGIESGGQYDISGGSSGKYHGAYQMGYRAMADAGRALGVDVPNPKSDPSGYQKFVSQFRSNPELQDRMFDAYTLKNVRYIMSNPQVRDRFVSRDAVGRAEVLGMAHSAGAGGASKFLLDPEGGESYDAFGTSGSVYRSKVGQALSGGELPKAAEKPAMPPKTTAPSTAAISTKARPVTARTPGTFSLSKPATVAAPTVPREAPRIAAAGPMSNVSLPSELASLLEPEDTLVPDDVTSIKTPTGTVATAKLAPRSGPVSAV